MDHVEQHQIQADQVDPKLVERLYQPHSKESHGCPFSWMASYHGDHSLQNIKYFENAVRLCKLEFPIRVWFNSWTDNIVISFVPLEAIKEPHIQEWYSTFYEVPVEEAKEKLTKYPDWPYDGRNRDTVRAELWVSGLTPSKVKKESSELLLAKGVKLIKKF